MPQALDSTVAYLGRSFPKFVSLSAGLAALLAPPSHVLPRAAKSSQLVLPLLFGALAPGAEAFKLPHRDVGTKVHVLENNEGLLERDFATYAPFYASFGLRCAKSTDGTSDICYCLKRQKDAYSPTLTLTSARAPAPTPTPTLTQPQAHPYPYPLPYP